MVNALMLNGSCLGEKSQVSCGHSADRYGNICQTGQLISHSPHRNKFQTGLAFYSLMRRVRNRTETMTPSFSSWRRGLIMVLCSLLETSTSSPAFSQLLRAMFNASVIFAVNTNSESADALNSAYKFSLASKITLAA